MKYKKIKINRLFHGFASIRDYQLEEAKKDSQGLEIWWGDEFIHIPFEDLDKCFHNNEIFRSKHVDGMKYKLVDFDWITFKKRTDKQENLFDL